MDLYITSYCLVRDNRVVVNDRLVFYQENILKFADFIKAVYQQGQINYPKFYKMDAISKLGFVAAELVLKETSTEGLDSGAIGVVLSNASSSLVTDIAHNETIKDRNGYFPSPSVFVYTLPNIVIGEICIKNHFKGENVFLISESFNARLLHDYVGELFENGRVDACLCGWTELNGDIFNAMTVWVTRAGFTNSEAGQSYRPLLFSAENMNVIMSHN